jgi:general secretion pathway protein H
MISSTRSRARRRSGPPTGGFTLIELLVVLVIAVAIVSIAVPQFSRSVALVQLHQASREAAALLRLSRNAAIAHASPVTVEVDPRVGSMRGANTEHAYALPAGVGVTFPTRRFEDQEEPYAIVFNADGTSTGGMLQLSTDQRSQQIMVDWLTGRVRIE